MRVSLGPSLALVLGLAFAAGACGGKSSGNASAVQKATHTGKVVANVGNDVITDDDVKKKLEEQSPFLRARYTTIDRKKEFLDNMIRFEVLAQEGERRGLDKSPEVQDTLKKVMVQQLIKQQFDEKDVGAGIPDDELKKFYQDHVDDYVKPERVRAAHILVAAAPGDAKAKSAAKKKAEGILKELKDAAAKGNLNAFAEAAQKNSNDQATAAVGGDTRYLSKDEMTKAYSEPMATAAFALKNPGDLTAVVEAPNGFEIVKLQGRQPALDRKFEDVRDQIKSRLGREKRTKDFEDFVKQLKDKAGIKIDEQALAAVTVPTEAQPSPFGGPPAGHPGGVPMPPPNVPPPGAPHGPITPK